MSLAAAQAMRDLAEQLRREADGLSVKQGRPLLLAIARAHDRTATQIEKRAHQRMGEPVPVPPEFQDASKRKS